jgi:phage N-6-adenine-methyltransferase
MNADLMFSSKTDLWATPQDFFDKLNALHRFELDVCATAENAKCNKYYTVADDGLAQQWQGVCWMNPPYGKDIKAWMKKAYQSSLNGAKVVCLVPARTDTQWWHDYAMKGQIEFIKGRLKFGGHKSSAPFPSAVVVFAGESVSVQRQDLNSNDKEAL